jgi:hypothetical protein
VTWKTKVTAESKEHGVKTKQRLFALRLCVRKIIFGIFRCDFFPAD